MPRIQHPPLNLDEFDAGQHSIGAVITSSATGRLDDFDLGALFQLFRGRTLISLVTGWGTAWAGRGGGVVESSSIPKIKAAFGPICVQIRGPVRQFG